MMARKFGLLILLSLALAACGITAKIDPLIPVDQTLSDKVDSPLAVVTGAPTGVSNSTLLSVTVAGNGIVAYKYLLGEAGSTNCSLSVGYSSELSTAVLITDNISTFAEGDVRLCVIGKNTSGTWQSVATATIATWTKNTLSPTATLTGTPTGINNTTTLAITVGGTDVASYKYKVGVSGSTDCTSSTGYSASTAIATLITNDISALADGSIKICVVGGTSTSNWQPYASATTATWTKDTVAPTATLTGTPTGTNNTTILAITVGGTDVANYKYKVGVSGSTDCSSSTGYSASAAIATNITHDISAITDGSTVKICVIGADTAGNWQTFASATSATWVKNAVTLSIAAASANEGSSVVFTVSLSQSGASNVTFDYATSSGTATSGADFTSTSSSGTITAGNTSTTISVPTTADTVEEVLETFTMTLSNVANATTGTLTATGTVVDATLKVDFASSAVIPSQMTFTRNGRGSYFDSSGVLRWTPGNFLTRSHEFNLWTTTTRASVSTNTVADPNATTLADSLTEDTSTTNTHFVQMSVSSMRTSYAFTFSVYAKTNGRDVRLEVKDAGGAHYHEAYFNLTNGTVTSSASVGSASGRIQGISSAGGGWYRIYVGGYTGTTATSLTTKISLASAGSETYTGDGVSGVYLFGAQLEENATATAPTTYIATSGTMDFKPRFDYKPDTNTFLGLLLEGSGTNGFGNSEALDNGTSWPKDAMDCTANATTAPDGLTTAESCVPTVAFQNHRIAKFAQSWPANANRTVSAFVKANGYSRVYMRVQGNSTTTDYIDAFFELSNGTINTTNNGGNGSAVNAWIQPINNGWYRIVMSGKPSTADSLVDFWLGVSDNTNTLSFAADGTSGIYAWGIQYDNASVPQSYVFNDTVSSARGLDTATILTDSAWYTSSAAWTVTFDLSRPWFEPTSVNGNPFFWTFFETATSTNTHQFYYQTLNQGYVYRVRNGGSTQAQIGTGASPGWNVANTTYQFALTRDATQTQIVDQGTVRTAGTVASFPAPDQMLFGAAAGGANYHLKKFIYFPRKLSNGELTALTTD
ncbi:MAG: phage head spike fiber domain-containing protein [Pseudobdellovibrionaceae bacterium]